MVPEELVIASSTFTAKDVNANAALYCLISCKKAFDNGLLPQEDFEE